MAAAGAPHILSLPPELILRVSTHLDTLELGAFRRSCKSIENVLFDSFAREFFTKRQFMLEEVSLIALVGIANHKTLSPYLEEVIIGLDTVPNIRPRHQTGEPRDTRHLRRQVFLETGRAMDLLVDAFSKLQNLRVLGLRDYEGKGRLRDGGDARWRSYGWSIGLTDAQKADCRDFHHYVNLAEGPTISILALLFGALDRAGSKPEAFEAFLRKRRLSLESFHALGYGLKTSSIISRLKRLMLTVQPISVDHLHDGEAVYIYDGLREFLRLASNLEHLRINFANHFGGTANFLCWLGSEPDPASWRVPPPSFPRLRNLDLGMLDHADAGGIITVICKLKPQSLALYRVALHCEDESDYNADPDVWACFLLKLSQSLPNSFSMQSISIGNVSQSSHPHVGGYGVEARVEFADNITVDENGERKCEGGKSQVSYKQSYGSDAREWLRDLSSKTWIPQRLLVASDSDEGWDEDEDDVLDDDELDEDEVISHEGEGEEEGDENHMPAEEVGDEEDFDE